MLGEGGRTACAGPVFHFRPEFSNTGGFPETLQPPPLLTGNGPSSNGRVSTVMPISWASNLSPPPSHSPTTRDASSPPNSAATMSCAGSLTPSSALTDNSTSSTLANPGAPTPTQLVRISYQRGNLAPVAKALATPQAGCEPLLISLSAAGSKDHEGDALTYTWRLHPGDQPLAQGAEAQVNLPTPGNYVVELIATDIHGASGRTSLPITVGNSPPEVRFHHPEDGDFFVPGQSVAYEVAVRDAEDGRSETDDELMDARVFVNARWSRGDGKESSDEPGLALMKQSDCFNCHAIETKIVGPPLLDVANKYR